MSLNGWEGLGELGTERSPTVFLPAGMFLGEVGEEGVELGYNDHNARDNLSVYCR